MSPLTNKMGVQLSRQDLGGQKGNAYRRIKRKIWLERQRKKKFLKKSTNKTYINENLILNKSKIILPKNLDYTGNYEKTAKHFRLIRESVRGNNVLKTIDFSKIRSVSTSAALVLASEVDCWNEIVSGSLVANVETWNTGIKNLLGQMGYFDLLNLPNIDYSSTGNTVFIKFQRGYKKLFKEGEVYKHLKNEIERIVGNSIEHNNNLYDGLAEAITNVSHHAYDAQKGFFENKPWWVSGSFHKKTRKLCVTFYDQGIGIPKSLSQSPFYKRIINFITEHNDSKKIAAAMKYKRTSTRKSERGLGLKDLETFAEQFENGCLSIYSGKGSYRNRYSKNKLSSYSRPFENNTSIGGTLIEWSVILPQ